MLAAVVEKYGSAPRYTEFVEPAPREGEVLVQVKAAALSPLVRAQAAGKHYSSPKKLPFIPGADGTGALVDGRRVYFAFAQKPFGSMAERVAIAANHCIPIPDGVDDVTAAAISNPGMSSWAALTERARFQRGEAVLINGATGAAGRLAVQIASYLGARRVVATGRKSSGVTELTGLGADRVIELEAPDLTEVFRKEIKENRIEVVLDYLWGASAESILEVVAGQGEAARRIRYVQIGSLAGPDIRLPAETLRSSGLELMGSGIGSVPDERLLASIAGVFEAVVPAGLRVKADPVPLLEVERVWNSDRAGRVVFTN